MAGHSVRRDRAQNTILSTRQAEKTGLTVEVEQGVPAEKIVHTDLPWTIVAPNPMGIRSRTQMMKANRCLVWIGLCLSGASITWLSWLQAQQSPQFTVVRRLTNQEIALTLSAPTGVNYRIDTGTNLLNWSALVTFPTNTASSLLYTDSATPFLSGRFYRAHDVTGGYVFSGDHLPTTNGDVIIHPMFHATFAMSWNGITIYSDPTIEPAYEPTYSGLPKADLILVTHSHGDHFNPSRIASLRTTNTVVICPQTVFGQLTLAQKTNAIVLGYTGASVSSTNVLGIDIQAVYAYNSNHTPLGFGNGYILTLGGKRIYISGDTGDAAELRGMTNIDVAFVCVNIPYTMTASQATNCVRGFQPRIVYPYHYRDQSGATTNAARFKQLLGKDLGIEVRLRKWY